MSVANAPVAPREFVAVCREVAALRRENDRLRSRLAAASTMPAGPDRAGGAPGRVPGGPVRCARCGLTLHNAAIQHDHALVFASCCPRCDGPLDLAPPIDLAAPDPAHYLG